MSETKADGFVTVAKVGEIPEGDVKVVYLDDQPVAVFRIGDEYFAMDDLCTHDGGELASGSIQDYEIECPRHGARFDVRTGRVLCMPATADVPTYAVRIQGDEIQVGWL